MDETLISTTTLRWSGPESNGNEGVFYNPQIPRLEPHDQMQFNVTPGTLNSFMYCYLTLIILFSIIHLFAHSLNGSKYYLNAIDPHPLPFSSFKIK